MHEGNGEQPSTPKTSLRLLQNLQSDDSAAWMELLETYDPLLRRVLQRRGVPEQAIDDILQETWQIVVREIRKEGFSHNGRHGAFRKWLKNIVGNQVRAAARRRRDDPLLTKIAEELDDPHSLSSEILRSEKESLIRDTMRFFQESGLWRADQSHAFVQVVLEGRSMQEVADELGQKYGTLATWLSRMRKSLRERLGPLFDESA